MLAVADVAPGASKAVMIEGTEVLVCNAGGTLYSILNQCSHQASKLEGGRIRNCFISCPLHGARFDLRDGSTKGELTNVPVKTFATRVVGGHVEVALG